MIKVKVCPFNVKGNSVIRSYLFIYGESALEIERVSWVWLFVG